MGCSLERPLGLGSPHDPPAQRRSPQTRHQGQGEVETGEADLAGAGELADLARPRRHRGEPAQGARTDRERDPARAEQARGFLERAGVLDRVELIEGDAIETIPQVSGPVDLLFVDATKGEYERYIELAMPLLADRCVLVVNNLLMSGEVALAPEDDTRWNPDSLAAARRLNAELMESEDWLACVLPVGDGIGFGARR